MTRRLNLRREALAELTTDELSGIAGAAVPPPTPVVNTLPINDCIAIATIHCATRLDCVQLTEQPRCF